MIFVSKIYCQLALVLSILNVMVHSQSTVSILTTLAPAVGDTSFSLPCNISNYEHATNRAFAWIKDNELVSWNLDIQGGFNGEITEYSLGLTIFYNLHILQVETIHGGVYKCLVADGQPTSYTELASAEVTLQIPYFPSQQYPMCSPSESTIDVIGNDLTMTCTSLPGSPDEVILLLQRNLATLSTGQTINNLKQVEYTHRVSSSDNGASFQCTIIGTGQFSDQRRTCTVGPLQAVAGLPRISPTILNKSVGQDATFTCELTFSGTIEWYTEPITLQSGYTENGMTFTLTNVQLSDNGKQVVCKATIGGAVVEDRAQLNVNPAEPVATSTVLHTTTTTTKYPTTVARTSSSKIAPGSTVQLNTVETTKETYVKHVDYTPSSQTSEQHEILSSILTTMDKSPSNVSSQSSDNLIVAVIVMAFIIFLLICIVIGFFVFKVLKKRQANGQGNSKKNPSEEHYEDLEMKGEENRAYMCLKSDRLKQSLNAGNKYHEYEDRITDDKQAVYDHGYEGRISGLQQADNMQNPYAEIS